MASKVAPRVRSFLETSEWGAPEAARPTPGASHASGRKNADGAYRPTLPLDAPIPSLQDDPEFVAIDARYRELQGEYNMLDAEINRLNGSLGERAKTEAERRLAEASALTSRPIASDAKPILGVEEVHRTLETLGARRALVARALQLQKTLRDDAWNRASKAAVEKARAHHQALVLQATEAAVELSRRLVALDDFVFALEEGQVFTSEFRQLTPPGEGSGVGRVSQHWSAIRTHLRSLVKAGYPVPNVPEMAEDQRIAS